MKRSGVNLVTQAAAGSPTRESGESSAQRRRYWSGDDLALLAKLYPARPTSEVAKRLGRTLLATYEAAQKLGVAKDKDYLQRNCRLQPGHTMGRESQFPKGHVPANAGLRRPGWHAGRMQETQFQKGCRTGMAAKNWKPIGTILRDTEGYLRIKVREAVHGKEATGFGNVKVWPLLNRHVWEQHKGPIPPKHVIKFKDRDRSNCAIDNLYMISMADNCRANSLWAVLPRELAEAIQLSGALKRKIRRATNGKK